MKKLFTLYVLIAMTISVDAQLPQKMSYQAVVRNTSGVLQTNQTIGIKISILPGSTTGTPVYVETHTATTNANGLVTLEIGGGAIVSGNFTGIDWSSCIYFIKTETDPIGGTNYTVTGTSQILSVPYALYAKTAKTADYNDLFNKPTLFDGTWISLTGKPTTLAGYGITNGMSTSHVANGITSVMITNWNTAYGWGNHAGVGYAIYPSQASSSGKFLTTNGTTVSWGTLATVAKTGSYDDLTNKPTNPSLIPNGNNNGDMLYWNGTSWLLVPVGSPGQYLQLSPSNIPTWAGATYPSVTTGSTSLITANTANVAGNISNDGGAPVISRGICYSPNQNPTIASSIVSSGTSTGGFFCTLPDLTSSTVYYARAFATNSIGTAYGNEISFTTLSSGGSQTVTDVEGHIYQLITIGSQIWLSENLRTKKYNNGDTLMSLVNKHTGLDSLYGRYYDYYTIVDSRGICPTGFRVPSSADFDKLANNRTGKDLASASGWDPSGISGTVGYEQELNNSSGFNAIPSGNASKQGVYGSYYYSYDNWKRGASFWTIDEANDALDIRAIMKSIYYQKNWVDTSDYPKDWTFCVRCIKN